MVVKGGLQLTPKLRMEGVSIAAVANNKVLEIMLDTSLSYGQHTREMGERAANVLVMSRVSATSWGIRYSSLKIIYRSIYVAGIKVRNHARAADADRSAAGRPGSFPMWNGGVQTQWQNE
ncbi:hypothetical protein EVAR_57354_1 [Eumeta japonica]|uniref:Uncharacterized protein n=1 Tax=Eumeta variegata TaxID=151549 RepID=A0A4C1ZGJ5_EUMVA|nr:hypothetical protein EVAR_57354_1 [Eumeta japonica]